MSQNRLRYERENYVGAVGGGVVGGELLVPSL